MGYYLRVLTRSAIGVPVSQLRQRLERDKISAILEGDAPETTTWTRLSLKHLDGTPITDIERNDVSPSRLGSEELKEFSEEMDECKPESGARWVKEFLSAVKTIYAFQVLRGTEQGHGWDAIWALEAEVWHTLGGIFQSDNEGFSNEDGYQIVWQFDRGAAGPWKMAVLGSDGRWTAFVMELGNPAHRAAFLAGRVPEGVRRL